jgi:hypothetical protein
MIDRMASRLVMCCRAHWAIVGSWARCRLSVNHHTFVCHLFTIFILLIAERDKLFYALFNSTELNK